MYIERFEEEIEIKKKELKKYKMQRARIQKAKEKVGDIQYEIIASINKRVASEYKVGKLNFNYYSSSDRKKVTYFDIFIIKCNKADHFKSREVLKSTEGYKYTEKQKLLQDLVEYIKTYQITKLYLQRSVTINTTELKKHFSNLKIVEITK